MRGSVIVSLRNMNRVLEINEECAYAVVEPGVRWFDLYEAIKAGEHRLMLSIADLGWGGVVGNTLDHGATYMPYGLDMGMQCGMEVVLADGTVMRTGMGAMPDNKSWHVYKRGLGPTPDQLFMQSNYGIVTKMDIIRNTAKAMRTSRRAVLAVLERYTGDDPERHRWNFTVREHGRMVFAPLARPAEGD